MSQNNVGYYNHIEDLDEELSLNFVKIWKIIWNRKSLITKVFCSVLIFFILLTFILPKKYKVTADLYINKSNSSNMIEFNPYMFEDNGGGLMASVGSDKYINNEIELMKSALVLDKVIRENHIVYKKILGIFPNKKEGEYVTAEAFYNKGKRLKIENTKNTDVITIQYKAKKPELAYGVVSSLITNYIELHKELNTEKSKSDTKLLESEYKKIKGNLNKSISQASGLPAQSMTGIGNLSAMSTFSRSASSAIGNIRNQYIAGEKSQIAVSEESQKLAQLAAKLEWAKIVEQMSDSSKVLVLKEPQKLRPFEKSSPKLFINIILGCIFGGLASLIALIFVEQKSAKLTYSMLTNNILFVTNNEIKKIENKCYGFKPKQVLILSFVQLPMTMINRLQSIPNISITYYNNSKDFIDKIFASDKIVLISKIDVTDAESYKDVRDIIKDQNKDIIYDVIL